MCGRGVKAMANGDQYDGVYQHTTPPHHHLHLLSALLCAALLCAALLCSAVCCCELQALSFGVWGWDLKQRELLHLHVVLQAFADDALCCDDVMCCGCAVLCCVVLCCAVLCLCSALLCSALLCCAVLCYALCCCIGVVGFESAWVWIEAVQ